MSLLEERIKRAGKKAVSTSSLEHSVATTPPPEEKPVEPVKVDPPVQTPVVENTENLKIPKARQVREGWGGVESLEGKGRMNGETSVCVCVCVCVCVYWH